MKTIRKLLLVLSLLFLTHLALAWSAGGHQLIAAAAYRALSPEFKAKAIQVLKAHPDYAKWQAAYKPNPSYDVYCHGHV